MLMRIVRISAIASSGMSSRFVPPRSDENSSLSDDTCTMSSYFISAQ